MGSWIKPLKADVKVIGDAMKEGSMKEQGAATMVELLSRRCSQQASVHSLAFFVLADF